MVCNPPPSLPCMQLMADQSAISGTAITYSAGYTYISFTTTITDFSTCAFLSNAASTTMQSTCPAAQCPPCARASAPPRSLQSSRVPMYRRYFSAPPVRWMFVCVEVLEHQVVRCFAWLLLVAYAQTPPPPPSPLVVALRCRVARCLQRAPTPTSSGPSATRTTRPPSPSTATTTSSLAVNNVRRWSPLLRYRAPYVMLCAAQLACAGVLEWDYPSKCRTTHTVFGTTGATVREVAMFFSRTP